MWEVPEARKWFSTLAESTIFDVINVVATGVTTEKISPSNMPPKRVRKRAVENNGLKISEDSHNFISDDIVRQDALEYDPNRVYTALVDCYRIIIILLRTIVGTCRCR